MAAVRLDDPRQGARGPRARAAPRLGGSSLSTKRSKARPTADDHLELAASVQRRIEAFYRLEQAPLVQPFIKVARRGEREAVRIREAGDGALEIEVRTPLLSSNPRLDALCQIIEGVSHFVYVADRARRQLPATQLELELQAEIDKYMLLVLSKASFDPDIAHLLHAQLYERVHFAHPEGTELGDRYRFANDLAARFVRRLEVLYAEKGRRTELRDALARFYGMGQADKIQYARAA
jgi:hypothetical protein